MQIENVLFRETWVHLYYILPIGVGNIIVL